MPADVLELHSARPPTGTVLNTKQDMIFYISVVTNTVYWPDVIQIDGRYLTRYPGGTRFNALVHGRLERNLSYIYATFKLILQIDDWGFYCKIALRWFSLDLTDGKSTLVQLMAWCQQEISHYLSQCWPSDMSQWGTTLCHIWG